MKRPLILLLTLSVFLSCQREEKLTFEIQEIHDENPDIDLRLHRAMGKGRLPGLVNRGVDEELISLLNYDEAGDIENLEGALKSFRLAYAEVNEAFPDTSGPWEAEIEVYPVFEDDMRLCLEIKAYTYTGGAHGYGQTRFLHFDKEKLREVDRDLLLQNPTEFMLFAEKLFRKQQGIPLEQPINSTGLMFENDNFYLPENIGFTEDGLVLLYNPYEIASYAEGKVELLIPYKDANPYLAFPVIP